MKKKILIIEPFNFIGPIMSPGHKKDMYIYKKEFESLGFIVENLYLKAFTLYKNSNEKADFNLFELARNKAMVDFKIIFSPYYSMRYIPLLFKKRKVSFYVCDSIMKTSIHTFFKNMFYFHRVLYGYISEILLRNHNIITVSIDEYLWFSSSGFQLSNLFMIPPTPLKNHHTQFLGNDEMNQKQIFFYAPNGKGIEICRQIILNLSEDVLKNFTIIISGRDAKKINIENIKANIKVLEYVDNIELMIQNSKLVILTDIGGSGFNNRAMQIRSLNIPLLSTIDGLRGTSLMFDDNVYTFNDYLEASFFVNQSIEIIKNTRSTISECLIDIHKKQLHHFLTNIFKE